MTTALITSLPILASALFGNPVENSANPITGTAVSIEFAVLLENTNPITGTAKCSVGSQCKLFSSEDPELEFSIQVRRTHETVEGQLSIDCGSTDCSFANGKQSTQLLNGRQFDFYKGKEAIHMLLVQRYKKPIGSLLLLYR